MSRPTLDVSHLPKETFGHRALPWWGTLGFMVIEGTTLAVAAASYLYLKRNYPIWPPPPTPLPELLVPTLGLVLLLLAIIPLHHAAKAADDVDAGRVRLWLGVATLMSIVIFAVRMLELRSLRVRWDDNAYGSVVWLIMGMHALLLLTDAIETGVFYAIFRRNRQEAKHYPDVKDAAMYQYFLTGVWVPLYVLIYLSPRFL